MRKNKFLRLASVMLMLCLITTCAISGTFAKYTTSNDVVDTARVAKWGVVVTAVTNGDMFAETYSLTATGTTLSENSVVSTSGDVLAPGTGGTLTSISITGTPEVAVKVSYEATLAITGWTINTDETYFPVVITVDGTNYKMGTTENLTGTNEKVYADLSNLIAAVEADIENDTAYYAANTDLSSSTVTEPAISWNWAYEGAAGAYQTDANDTALGNLAANGTAPAISLTIRTTVDQVD